MSWAEAANDPLVLKAWQDALRETHPTAVDHVLIVTQRDPDEATFCAVDKDGRVLRLAMTADLFTDLVFSKRHNPACPDAQCDPLYEALLRQLQRGP